MLGCAAGVPGEGPLGREPKRLVPRAAGQDMLRYQIVGPETSRLPLIQTPQGQSGSMFA